MNKVLTLVVPMYKLTKIEIENWKWIINETKENKKLQILLLSDNPKQNDLFEENFGNEIFHRAEINKGKYQLIKDAVDNGLILGRWFKVCDPDDIILVDRLNNFIEDVKDLRKDYFISFEYSLIIEPNNWSMKQQNLLLREMKERKLRSLTNENSVHPTQDIKNFDLKAMNQTKTSDVLFSLASDISTEEDNIIWTNNSFYLYNLHKGISNGNVKNKIKYKNDNAVKELFTFFEIIGRYPENNLLTPSFWDYRWLHNRMLNNKYNLYQRIKYSRKAFKILKSIARNNLNYKKEWNFREKFAYTFLYQIFRKRV